MNGATISVRRVVFGISGWGDAEEGLELALAMAKAMDLMVNCLLPERRDLLAAAGLPFARITSHGGLSSPVTRDDMAASLRRQQRQAEQSVTARCRSAGVSLSIDRPSGEYASGLLSSVTEGDVVVIERDAVSLADITEALLRKVNAVVLPGSGQSRPQAVLWVAHEAEGLASVMAEDVAMALGLPLNHLAPSRFLSAGASPAIIVVPAGLIAELGGLAEIRRHAGRAATLILVREGV